MNNVSECRRECIRVIVSCLIIISLSIVVSTLFGVLSPKVEDQTIDPPNPYFWEEVFDAGPFVIYVERATDVLIYFNKHTGDIETMWNSDGLPLTRSAWGDMGG